MESTQEGAALAIVRQLWRWGGWLFSLALGIAGRELLAGSEATTEVASAVVTFVAWFAMTVGAGMLLIWCGFTFWGMTHFARFYRMAEDIRELRHDLGHCDKYKTLEVAAPYIRAKAEKLMYHLDGIGVRHPTLKDTGGDWENWATSLQASSQAQEYKKACELWKGS